MTVPFRIGLLQDGEWEVPASLAWSREFRGFVVFLVNRGRKAVDFATETLIQQSSFVAPSRRAGSAQWAASR